MSKISESGEYGIEYALSIMDQYVQKDKKGRHISFTVNTDSEYKQLVEALEYVYEDNASSYKRYIILGKK